ncbi:MAG: LLM class F420-dependent oxidoreductase [Proteobacteria bacterium]|nr:LLM class F420-dependent oxidoreductase [Pseudomonadota bacterium]
MKIGLFPFLTDYTIGIADLAVEAEARGFDSIWLPEHTHIPASRQTAYPGGGDLPKEYSHTLDPFVALGCAAAVTEKLLLATGICLAIEHQAITLAKTVATLDHISNGRVMLGLGAGWNREEMENHGTAYADRFKKLEEQMQALRTIWTEPEASFNGRFEKFESIWSWPKPIRQPHPPLILGGETDHTLKRIVKYGNGWLPRSMNAERVIAGITKLDRYAKEAGRDPASISVSAFAVRPKAEVVDQFRDTRAERVILMVPPRGRDETLARLDRYTDFIRS